MGMTAITEKLATPEVVTGEYCGATTVLSFGAVPKEFRALRNGCGIYDLGWRSKIIISGKDRVRWLNGMITNNIRDLQPERGNYSFLLTPQGHIQGDLYAYNRGDYILLGTDRFQAQTVIDRLKKYIIMDKVELEDVSDRLTAIGVQGPKTRDVLNAAGLDLPDVEPMQVKDFSWQEIGLTVTRMAFDKFLTYEVWVATEHAAKLWDALVRAGATPVGAVALEMFRVSAGIPRYGLDIRESNLPQETGQNQALNFSKGCYIGQEIVERIRARGSVHRTLTGFIIEGAVPASGTKVLWNGKEAGEVTSAVQVPSGDGARVLGIGIARCEIAKQGTQVQVGNEQATVSELPFAESNS